MEPLVTIKTVVFNGVKHIEQTIQSVINQTYKNIEYIVIDGGSTDGTLDIIKKYDKIIDYWISEKDGGIYDAMNKGILLAGGTLIGLVNCGDWLKTDAVEQVVASAKKHSNEIFIISGGMDLVDEDGMHLYTVMRNENILKNRFQFMPLNHGSTFISTQAFRQYGLYNTTYRIAADYELVLRMIESGVKIYFLGCVLSCMRCGGVSDEMALDWKKIVRIKKEHYSLIVKYKGRPMASLIIIRNSFFMLMKRLIPRALLNRLWHIRHACVEK